MTYTVKTTIDAISMRRVKTTFPILFIFFTFQLLLSQTAYISSNFLVSENLFLDIHVGC